MLITFCWCIFQLNCYSNWCRCVGMPLYVFSRPNFLALKLNWYFILWRRLCWSLAMCFCFFKQSCSITSCNGGLTLLLSWKCMTKMEFLQMSQKWGMRMYVIKIPFLLPSLFFSFLKQKCSLLLLFQLRITWLLGRGKLLFRVFPIP